MGLSFINSLVSLKKLKLVVEKPMPIGSNRGVIRKILSEIELSRGKGLFIKGVIMKDPNNGKPYGGVILVSFSDFQKGNR